MNLIYIIMVLIIIGVALYMVNQYIPMAPPIKTIINVVVILLVVLWLLTAVFNLGNVTIPVRR